MKQKDTPKSDAQPDAVKDRSYPAGMEDQRGEPEGLGHAKPGPKNPPEAATVEDDEPN